MPMEPVPEDWERALAIVAHPDDLEFGASAALARWTSQGKSVVEVLATRGEAGIESIAPEQAAVVRTREQEASGRVVGASGVEFLDHRDGTLEHGLPLRRDLAGAIRRHRPEVIVTINFDDHFAGSGAYNHADHRALGLAVVDAVRDAANRWVFPELVDQGLEPWSGVRFVLVNGSLADDHFVDVTDHLDKGITSLHEHRVYLDGLSGGFDVESFLRGNAQRAGQEAGVPLAVTFRLIPA